MRLEIKTFITVATLLVSLAGHAAVLEYRLIALEERRDSEDKSLRKMELTLCRMCTHLLPQDSCKICE